MTTYPIPDTADSHNSQTHCSTSSGKTLEGADVTVHETQYGKSGKASDISLVISSGEVARRVRGKGNNGKNKEGKK
ncbi:hypothetical protein E5D57_009887 [Metarhizium anisopliae]|nr:hypothetical protein E5D57_009887 [Metarhizium anisopliae]